MLILLRHGQTDANASGLLLGRNDVALTDLGRHQAVAAGAVLPRGARVISSPLRRARETAALAFEGIPVHSDDRWTEMDYGAFDGVKMRDVPADVRARWRDDPEFRPPGGESLAAVGRRVREAVADLVDEASHSDVIVVSHVSPIKAAIAWALGVGDEVAWRLHLSVAGISRLSLAPASLLSFNETDHLGGPGGTGGA